MRDTIKPVVTVIIPTFNRGHCIGRAIQSVIDQTFNNWELIIVDNDSTDNSLDVIASFMDKRISVIKINNEGNIARSRNLGIKEANGVFTAFLDSDDWWRETKLEASLNQLLAGKDLIYHDLYEVSKLPIKENCLKVVETRTLEKPVFNDLLAKGNGLINSSVVVRTNLLRAIKGFSEQPELVGSEDFDCWIRISKLTDKFEKLEGTLGYYWIGSESVSSAQTTLKNVLYLRQRYGNDINNFLGAKTPGWLIYSLARGSLAAGCFSEARRYALLCLTADLDFSRKLKATVLVFLSFLRLKM